MSVDIVCLSGYLRVLSREFIRRWPQRILSLHASLLPAFPGSRPEREALQYGAQVTGCTVSLLDQSSDPAGGGPIVVQRTLPIADTDTEATLVARLLPEQYEAYVEAIRRLTGGGYELRGRRFLPRDTPVPVAAAPHELSAFPELV